MKSFNGELNPDNDIDTDGDTLTDWEEVNVDELIELNDGSYTLPKVTLKSLLETLKRYDNDEYFFITGKILPIYYLPILSDPTEKDSDGDRLIDSKDAQPFKIFDTRFINTSNYVENITNDNIDKKEKAANATYNSASLLDKFFFNDTYYNFYFGALANVVSSKPVKMPTAGAFLNHFLSNTGKDYFYDASTVIEGTNGGRSIFIKNMNEVIDFCESTVVDDLWFITNPATSFPGTNFTATGCAEETEIAADWWYSIGDADSSMSFHCVKKGNTYTATITYNLLDYYDWDPSSPLRGGLVHDGDMYDLHRAGWAREYKSVGTYTKEITWNKGDRLSEEFIL